MLHLCFTADHFSLKFNFIIKTFVPISGIVLLLLSLNRNPCSFVQQKVSCNLKVLDGPSCQSFKKNESIMLMEFVCAFQRSSPSTLFSLSVACFLKTWCVLLTYRCN